MTSLPLPHLRLSLSADRRRVPPLSRTSRPPAASAATPVDLKPAAGEKGRPRSAQPPAAATKRKLLDDTEVEPRGLMDFIEQSRDLIRPDGGPPRWFSPVECGPSARDVESPPTLFFLPGLLLFLVNVLLLSHNGLLVFVVFRFFHLTPCLFF